MDFYTVKVGKGSKPVKCILGFRSFAGGGGGGSTESLSSDIEKREGGKTGMGRRKEVILFLRPWLEEKLEQN